MMDQKSHLTTFVWGNATYVDCAIGETFTFLGKAITLLRLENNYSVLRIGATERRLIRVERELPEVIEGVRVFVADNRNVKQLSTDPEVHGLLQKDALVCVSDPALPLLNPALHEFPISRVDGYHWHMEETSGMFTYYGEPWRPHPDMDYFRSHEGIDFNLHDGRGIEKHPQVAIEDGVVIWAVPTNEDEACVAIQSASNPKIYYIYQHLCNRLFYVKDGQLVKKGETMGYNWGDGVWGHLHLSVVHREAAPGYDDRYANTFNFFPQVYELWQGDLRARPRVWREGTFTFAHPKAEVENKLHVNAYQELLGYGWKIGDWCTAVAMQRHPQHSGSISFKKTLHAGHPAEAVNPENHYTFEIAVEPGTYAVRARMGDVRYSTWQRVVVGGVEAGNLDLDAGEFAWTEEVKVAVPNSRLIVQVWLKDSDTYAGISELHFAKLAE